MQQTPPAKRPCTTVRCPFVVGGPDADLPKAIVEGQGDAALTLLKAGAESDKRDVDGFLALECAPDAKVKFCTQQRQRVCRSVRCG